MHLPDGILPTELIWATNLAGVTVVSWQLYQVTREELPRIALLSSAFFVTSTIQIPSYPFSVHLVLGGLLGILLRSQALLAVGISLAFQALLLGHGGVLAWGANLCVLGLPAVLVGWVFPPLIARSDRQTAFILGAVAGTVCLIASACLAMLMVFSNHELGFRALAGTWGLLHLPVLLIEGLVTGQAVLSIKIARPELLAVPTAKKPNEANLAHAGNPQAPLNETQSTGRKWA